MSNGRYFKNNTLKYGSLKHENSFKNA